MEHAQSPLGKFICFTFKFENRFQHTFVAPSYAETPTLSVNGPTVFPNSFIIGLSTLLLFILNTISLASPSYMWHFPPTSITDHFKFRCCSGASKDVLRGSCVLCAAHWLPPL